MWGMIRFSDALFIGRCTPRRRVRLSPLPESQVEEKGDETENDKGHM